MRFRPLLAVAAAAGLLAAGCDYWRNLVDGKTVATARLRVQVKDKFTHEPLVATCTDSTRGFKMETTSGDGEADTLDAGTGKYNLICKAPWGYYEKTIAFPLTPAGDTVFFGLARLGGKLEWYLGDTLREVRIRERFDTLRFPGNFDFHAYPEDTTGLARFRYEWTFSKAKGLDQITSHKNASIRTFHITPTVNTVPGPDTLTLNVWSMLRKDEEFYHIGTDQRPFVWVRNQLPLLDLVELDTMRQYSVGCRIIDQPLRIRFRGVDPEGQCKSVRFFTDDSTSAFGDVNITMPCFDKSDQPSKINFGLKDRFDHLGGDTTMLRRNKLNISVTDDNGGVTTTPIWIMTRSNVLPTVASGFVNPRNYAFIDDSVRIWFEAYDRDGTPQSAIVNWIGEGATTKHNKSSMGNTFADTASWTYETPGYKHFNVFVTDICNGGVNGKIDSILIRANRVPDVQLTYLRNEGTDLDHLHAFELSVKDKDISEGLVDSLTEVYVNWHGEGSRLVATPNFRSTFVKKLTHHFSNPPDSLGRYQIEISVHDAHRGIGRLDTLFLIP